MPGVSFGETLLKKMKITLHDPDNSTAYSLNVNRRWVSRHDNGALVSCGIWMDGGACATVSRRLLNTMIKDGRAVKIDAEKAKHSGCQSSCIKRGDAKCSW